MKIILAESQYINLLESSDRGNVIERILEMKGIEYDGCNMMGEPVIILEEPMTLLFFILSILMIINIEVFVF